MIIHASIPADEPERVARVLAHLWGGESMPFPPYPGSFIAISGAGDGAEIEVVPRALEQVPGEVEVDTRWAAAPSPYSATHLALATALDEEALLALAAREGWIARRCNRGGVFDVVELWLENRFMVELLTPAMQAQYRAFMSPQRFRELFDLRAG